MDARRLQTLGAFAGGMICLSMAVAPRFDNQVTYTIGKITRTAPEWSAPPSAKFKKLEPGYGPLKLSFGLLSIGLFARSLHLSRKYAAEEPRLRKIASYNQRSIEFEAAAQAAYQMAKVQHQLKTMLSAEQVAFEGEIENAYLESLGIDPSQPRLTGTATLDSVTSPGDKITDTTSTVAIEAEVKPGPKIPNLTWYPSVLIYGAPGSGKSTFAADEIAKRKQAGHRVVVLDPHAAYGAWAGCEVIGGGMDYAAIDEKLGWFASEVSRRYKIVLTEPNPNFEPLTFVCDEFTRWGSKCANSAEFFEQLVTDIRKVEMFGLIISHTRTLVGLANAKGFASLRDEALLEIEILGNQDEESGRATPRFEALVKLPGTPLNRRFLVPIKIKETKEVIEPCLIVSPPPSPLIAENPNKFSETEIQEILGWISEQTGVLSPENLCQRFPRLTPQSACFLLERAGEEGKGVIKGEYPKLTLVVLLADLLKIYRYCKQRGVLKLRDIQRASIVKTDSQTIKNMLLELQALGLGTVTQEGDSTWFAVG